MGSQLAPGLEGLLVFDGDDLVVDGGVQRLGHEPGADALNLVGAGAALGEHGGSGRFHGHHLDGRVLRLQIGPGARKRAAGAHAGHEDVHHAIGVLPDLRASGTLVHGRIRRVGELRGNERVRNLRRQPLGLLDGALHALGAFGEHQFRPKGAHEVAPLHGHGLGHDDDDAVAPHGGDGRKADAGVAGGGLDRLVVEDPGLHGGVDHRLGGAVLHRAGGVERLHLPDERGGQLVGALVVGQLHQRRMPDQLGDVLVDGHGKSFLAETKPATGRRRGVF